MLSMTDQKYIEDLHDALLGRGPSSEEVNKYLAMLQDGCDHREIFSRIKAGAEHKNRVEAIDKLNASGNLIFDTRSDRARDPEHFKRVLKFLAYLAPFDVVGYRKIRVGRAYDGGYIMIDDFDDIQSAYSLGISDDVSWDLQIADMGIDVFQYDGTIAGLPQHHPRFNWQGVNISPETDSERNLINLKTAFSVNGTDLDQDHILKMDIEGHEWDVFEGDNGPILKSFRQIVCELHDFHKLADSRQAAKMLEGVRRLTAHHSVVHVHANNCAPFVVVGGVPIPDVVELTLIRRDDKIFTPTDTVFPTDLDQPNTPLLADLYLGKFRFP